ncbi:hypothetical protein [Desertibacillus haloalkaliphilus]|uniref:hypothetical protein n=1 Tax=Desertibacillus haloalkaliphilus TaxID=1328930 RepID=UPI001C25EA7A|nr:hypothetical protein [Desertibacillus haloalkaliphilus]MBU8908174.1 hypothetical protein [Desertibacillus haloalkaliphilus]
MKSYKGREPKVGMRVQVYRNLNVPGVAYSIKSQKSPQHVLGHARSVHLKDVTFVVNQKGREKTISEGRKRVHAFLVGTLVSWEEDYSAFDQKVYYDPYQTEYFTLVSSGEPLETAMEAVCKDKHTFIKDCLYVIGEDV